jgi:hypothetical protein
VVSAAEIAGICAGGAAVVVAGVASSLMIVDRRRRRRVESALSDPNPVTRIAALELLAVRGVSGHLGALVDRVLIEDDPRVQTVLAQTLIKTQWGASADRRLLMLRTWATRVAGGPATSPSAQEAGPPPGVALLLQDDRAKGGLGAGQQRDDAATSLPPASADREFDELEENEQRVMDWLLSPEPSADAPRARSLGTAGRSPPRDEPLSSVAKAEQKAIALLRAAGYGVTSTDAVSGSSSPPESTGAGAASEVRVTAIPDEARLLRQLGAEQAVRLNLLEQMIRRVQAENARLEAELGHFSEHADG